MDIWKNTEWTLDDATNGIKDDVMGKTAKKENAFKFVASRRNGKVVFYTIKKPSNSCLPDRWTKVIFLPRGTKAPVLTPSATPLSNNPAPGDLLARAAEIKGQLTTSPTRLPFSTRRLEGDMDINQIRHAVTIWQAPNEFKGTQPLLVISIVADPGTNPDGVGTGYPR